MTAAAAINPTKQLELFALRSFDFADRVEAGEIQLRDAVDILQDAAVSSGLVDRVGPDAVQAVMAVAFGPVRRRI